MRKAMHWRATLALTAVVAGLLTAAPGAGAGGNGRA
jgi:hypothetical protein